MQQCMTWVKQCDMGINHAKWGPIHSVGSCNFSRGWAKVVDLFLAYNKVIYSLKSKPFTQPVSVISMACDGPKNLDKAVGAP
jgi:hypothetical protein